MTKFFRVHPGTLDERGNMLHAGAWIAVKPGDPLPGPSEKHIRIEELNGKRTITYVGYGPRGEDISREMHPEKG